MNFLKTATHAQQGCSQEFVQDKGHESNFPVCHVTCLGKCYVVTCRFSFKVLNYAIVKEILDTNFLYFLLFGALLGLW